MFGNTFEDILSGVRTEIWLAIGIVFVAFVVDKYLKTRKLPPGPVGLPIVGYLPFLTKFPHLKFIKLTEKYGSVFSMHLGSQLVVVLNGIDDIREAFSKQELLARPPNSPLLLFKIETPFFTSNYKMWKEQRRFVVQSMKDLGLGKTKIEDHMQDEIRYFLNVLEQFKGKPMNLVKPLTPSMSNNICALVFGERYQYDNPDRVTLDDALDYVSRTLVQTNAYMFFPWTRHFPFIIKWMKLDKAVEAFGRISTLIERKIRQHAETLDSKNIRDFIDSYLLEIKDRSGKDSESTFSDETLKGCVVNLFGAGSETVRTLISWCMYTMAAYPKVQQKVQEEIDSVVGSNRLPQFPDQKDMPYTQAVIREVLRWKTVAPLNLVRYVMEDVNVSGYHIPKGTVVLANLWAVHHNPKHWKDPESFLPERFLNTDGTLLKTNNFIPFSVGKRACPGETMALMEGFLYFASILQKFNVSFPEGFKPDFEAELGITYHLKPFEICFTPK